MRNELNVLNYRNILSTELWPTYTNKDKFNQGVKKFKEHVHEKFFKKKYITDKVIKGVQKP